MEGERGDRRVVVTESTESRPSLEATRDADPRGTGAREGPPLAEAPAGRVRAVGESIGRFIVLGRLGAGGMGVVYACHDPELDRRVAVKVLRDERGDGLGESRLLREAQAMARLQHPSVVAVHDVGVVDGSVWIAMEFVEGRTLREWCAERPRSWREVFAVLERVGEGLAAAHAAGLVHRDVKPDNVMIDRHARVRVMDFGLARAETGLDAHRSASNSLVDGADARIKPLVARASAPVASLCVAGERATAETESSPSLRSARASSDWNVALTRVGAIVGTPAYMAPEQIAGALADARSDIFSWAVMCWEAIAGERPFAGDSLAAIAFSIEVGQIRAARLRARAPRWLVESLQAALAADPARRPATFGALFAALARRRRRRTRRIVGAVATGVVLLTGTAAGAQRWRHAAQVHACAEGAAEILAQFEREFAPPARQAFLATGADHAADAWQRHERSARAWMDRWRTRRADLCVEALTATPARHEELIAIQSCLDDQRGMLLAVETALIQPSLASLASGVTAITALPPPTQCETAAALRAARARGERGKRSSADAELRQGIHRLLGLRVAGRYAEGLEQARALVSALDEGIDPTTAAELHARRGELAYEMVEIDEGNAAMNRAFRMALASGDDALATGIALTQAHELTQTAGRRGEGGVWIVIAQSLLDRADLHGTTAEASLETTLARVALADGAFDRASGHLDRVEALEGQLLGPDHPHAVVTMLLRVRLLQRAGRVDDALALGQQAIERAISVVGPSHPQTALTYNNVANIYVSAGRELQARPMFEQSLAIRRQALGPRHTEVAETLSNLAICEKRLGHVDLAIDLARQALAIETEHLGPTHPSVAASYINLGAFLIAADDLPAARESLTEAVSRLESLGDPPHMYLPTAALELGLLELEAGQIDAAQLHLSRAEAVGDGHLDADEFERLREGQARVAQAQALRRR